ncbi:MAG TPA: radical SAM protein, partial [Actinomycetota bacterium]|nr:radical SAM protein [Actinomycetota bacterium]
NTDPYQRCEGKYELTRGVIEALVEYRNPFSILTRGTLMLRDIDLLTEAAQVSDIATSYSVATLDEEIWRKTEPGTPHPRKRLEAVRRLNEAGVPCGVLVAPILPGISDGLDQIKTVVEASLDAGATHVSPILLHLRPRVKEVYMEWLEDNYPDLVPRYQTMYRKSAYAGQDEQDELRRTVRDIVVAAGGVRPRVRRSKVPRWRAEIERQKAQLGTEQLSLI